MVIKKLRQQCLGLGVLWAIIGGIGVLIVSAFMEQATPATIFGLLLALLWCACGVLTYFRKLPAVLTGLILFYLSLAAHLVTLATKQRFNLVVMAIILISIIQAHRILSFGKKMKQTGVPLDTKPSI